LLLLGYRYNRDVSTSAPTPTNVPGQVQRQARYYFADERLRCRAPFEDLILNEGHCACYSSIIRARMAFYAVDSLKSHDKLVVLLHSLMHMPWHLMCPGDDV